MLIEFRAENYRSIKTEQGFSMVASGNLKEEAVYRLDTGFLSMQKVIPAAVFFGANGSGKSTLVDAMGVLQGLVINSAREGQMGDLLPVTPYLFSSSSKELPTKFEIIFITEGKRYEYGVKLDAHRIHEEWLFVREHGRQRRTQLWFERVFEEQKKEYHWYINKNIKGQREVWRKATRPNALFLSTAVQLKSEMLEVPFEWLRTSFRLMGPAGVTPSYSARLCQEKESKQRVLKFLNFFDFNVVDILVKEKKFEPDEVPDDIPEQILDAVKGITYLDVAFCYKGEEGERVEIDLDDESSGTKSLFALAGPLLDVIDQGLTLIVDELNASLHSVVLRKIVSMFGDSKINRSGCQLLFTSHDTTILSENLVGRDQVWFLDRKSGADTKITPLSDFKARKSESLQRRFLSGRYGGIPLIEGDNRKIREVFQFPRESSVKARAQQKLL